MFGFGKKRKEVWQLMDGLYDVHCHLLPGVDDGSPSAEISLKLLDKLAGMGVEGAYLTPHVMAGAYGRNDRISLNRKFEAFGYDGPIKLKLAAEHLLDEKFPVHLQNGPLTLANEYVLVEFTLGGFPARAFDLLFEISLQGYTPILAHPERYAFLQHRMQREQLLGRLLDAGCKFQLNLLSLTGWHGEHAKKLAEELIRRNLYTFVGTDLHSFPHLNAIETLSVENRQAEAVEKLKENNLLLWQ